jgi:hypothetical protein
MTAALPARRACEIAPWLFALYAAASLWHFAHNAEYVAHYPNLPSSWSRTDIYLAGWGVTAVGVLGYVLERIGYRRVGLTVLALYGALGFAGLLHYTRAPVSHHSAVMNLTIWLEVAAAALFLINVASVATCRIRINAGAPAR